MVAEVGGEVTITGRFAMVEGGGDVISCKPRIQVGEVECGMVEGFNNSWPGTAILTPKGLGLRLRKLPIGLANPLLRPLSMPGETGETTEI